MSRCQITEAQAPLRTVGQERNLTIVGKFYPHHDDSNHDDDEDHHDVCDDDEDHEHSQDEVPGRSFPVLVGNKRLYGLVDVS